MHRRDVLRAAGLAVGSVVGSAGSVAGRTSPARTEPDRAGQAARRRDAAYRPLGRLPIEGATEAVVGADGTTVALAVTDGFAIADVSDPADPALLAERRGLFADREGGPLQSIHDVAVDGDALLVVGRAHPVSADALHGAAVYDVSTPASPTLRAFHETDYPIHNADLAGGVAYLTRNTAEETALVTVDVTRDPPDELARWSIVQYDRAWAAVPPSVRAMHDVTVHGDVASLAHWDAGTWLLDVADPANPAVVARVGEQTPAALQEADPALVATQLPGNSHYAAMNDGGTVLAVGREAWDVESDDDVAGGPGGIDLYDVTDPTAPEKLATIDPPPTPDPTLDGVWTTAHNFDFHGDRLYTSWYRGGVKRFDVADPADPRELAWWRKPDEASFWAARHAAGCFVGSSRRDPSQSAGAALYTFPDRPGEQPDPPSLTTNATTRSTTAARQTTTPPSTTTPTTTRATTPASATNGTGKTTETTETTGTATPGFTALGALGAVGLAAWRRRRG